MFFSHFMLFPTFLEKTLSPEAPKARDGRYCNASVKNASMYFLETLQVRAPCHGGCAV